MSGLSDYSISVHNPKDFTDAEIAEAVALGNILSAEIFPDDPPSRVEDAIASLRTSPDRYRRWSIRARDRDGNLVASTGTGYDPDHDDNPDIFWGNVNVHPDHRRKGLGTALLAELVRLAEENGRKRIIGHVTDRVPAGAAFAAAIGAEEKLAVHTNRVLISDVDRALMQQWVDEGPVRADGYELIGWTGPVPDEYLDQWVDLVLVMNTAPRDDLEMNDFTLTPQEVREQEAVAAAVGVEEWVLVARRIEDGAWAGFHNVTWQPSEPDTVYVDSTGVRPEHRGHALGKWLKAAMQLRILDERPNVTEVRTGNADSNDAMLGINRQMGYRPFVAHTNCELLVDKARAYLDARGALDRG